MFKTTDKTQQENSQSKNSCGKGIEHIMNWHIFDRYLSIQLAPVASGIFFVIRGLTNFQLPLTD